MRRKIIALAFTTLLTGALMGCSNDISTNMKSNDDYGYDEILSKIAASIESGEESDKGEFSYMYPKFGGMGGIRFWVCIY